MPFHNLFTPVVIMKAIEKGPDYASWWFACVWPQMSSSIGGVSLVYYYVVVHSKAAVKHSGEFSSGYMCILAFLKARLRLGASSENHLCISSFCR